MPKATVLILLSFLFSTPLLSQSRVLDSLKVALKTTQDTSRVNTLNELAKASHFVNEDDILRYSLEAQELSKKLQYNKGLAKAYCNIGVYYAGKNDDEKAVSYLKQSLSIVDPDDHYLRIILNYNLSFYEENPQLRSRYLKNTVEMAKKIRHKRTGFFYSILGNFYYRHTDYDSAFSCYIEGLKEAEQLKDSTAILMNLDAIGDVLNSTGENGDESSFAFCLRALKIAEQIGSNRLVTVIKNNLSDCYRNKGNLDTAHVLILQSLALAKQINYDNGVAENLSDLGLIFHLRHNYEQALLHFRESLATIGSDETNILTACVLGRIGTTYNALGKHKQAIPHLEHAISIAKNFSNKKNLIIAYYELSQAYQKLAAFSKALQYYELYHALHDSVYNMQAGKRIVSMQAKYEMEKKEHAIEVLEQNNKIKDLTIFKSKITLALMTGLCIVIFVIALLLYSRYKLKKKANVVIMKANDEILSMVKQREVLVQEIHHRAKNNLQMISSLLMWQTETIEDKEMLRILSEGRSRIKSMALIHESLYKSDNVAQLDLDEYVGNLIDYLEKIYNKDKIIKINKQIHPISLDIDVTIPLGLIITELISNAFKYAFPKGNQGCIEVLLWEEKPEIYQLQIKDNGIGMPAALVNDVEGNTMGIQLVKILVKQIRGHLDFHNEQGSSFSITFSNIHYQQKSLNTYREEYAHISS
jgi:two-component sensor histidine kinase